MEEQTVTSREYAVGLSREEYVYSQQLAAKTLRGKYLLGSRLFSAIMMVLCVLMVVADRLLAGNWDISLLVIVVLMVAVELWVFITSPSQIRRQHGLLYDKTLFHGYSFDGVLTLDDRGVTKKTSKNETTVLFMQCTAFIEDSEMMMFCSSTGKSIVIPKRFFTEDDAELTRRVALAAIPPSRCYLRGQVDAQLTERLPLPDEGVPAPEDPLLELRVEYTPKEMKAQVTETALRTYVQKLPQKSLTAVLVTILAYFGFEISPLPTFLLCSVLLFVFSVVGSRMRVGRMLAAAGGEGGSTRITFTDTVIKIQGKGDDVLTVPWKCVTRAVSAPKDVEFYVNGEKAFLIPKRCVEDMAVLTTVVDAHLITG